MKFPQAICPRCRCTIQIYPTLETANYCEYCNTIHLEKIIKATTRIRDNDPANCSDYDRDRKCLHLDKDEETGLFLCRDTKLASCKRCALHDKTDGWQLCIKDDKGAYLHGMILCNSCDPNTTRTELDKDWRQVICD